MQNPLKSVSNRLWVLEELSTYTDARAPRAHVHRGSGGRFVVPRRGPVEERCHGLLCRLFGLTAAHAERTLR